MKRMFALMTMAVLTAGLSFAGEGSGFVTDLKCAKAGKAGAAHAGCAKGCIGGGAEAAIVTDDGKVMMVANQDAVKSHAGEKVSFSYTEADGKITVSDVKTAQ
ncbi:MAG: hypothetical protein H6509_14310 [Bryobacterales bacterium]|nr:hypothetical protein [Acidobacteriota bacterium]MCB9385785.1 hypothetical protein [Bryobacterales bacterium]